MAGQGIERREMLRILSIAAVARDLRDLAGGRLLASMCSADSTQIRSATYAPRFFCAMNTARSSGCRK